MVKKLEKNNRSRTHRLKRLHKVGLTDRVESYSLKKFGEDASKQVRIDAIDAYEEITLVNVHDVNISADEEVFVAVQEVAEEVVEVINTAKLIINVAQPMKKKDSIRLDEETALNLQAEFDEEERLAREKAEANIALIET
ncbi:hypothetical protein Tco_0693045 [Tanacetum coccineum]